MIAKGNLASLDILIAFFFFSLVVSLILPLLWQDSHLIERSKIESAWLETDYWLAHCVPPHLLSVYSFFLDCQPSKGFDQNIAQVQFVSTSSKELLYEKKVPNQSCFTLQRITSFHGTVGLLQTRVCA